MIDFEKALSGMGGDSSLLNETLQDFIDFYADAGERIETAVSEQRYHDVGILVHTLKGLGATFAAEELNCAATSMEQALQHEAPDQLDEPLTDLKEVIGRTVAEIRVFLRK
ncbi:MAG: Hpt domain-containing protein [Gammaproteobacteria bacterium]|nr:Hpt domain-containing protein [Gammaproteobacteria bacterium]